MKTEFWAIYINYQQQLELYTLQLDAGGYDSSYEGDEEQVKRKKRKHDLSIKEQPKTQGVF